MGADLDINLDGDSGVKTKKTAEGQVLHCLFDDESNFASSLLTYFQDDGIVQVAEYACRTIIQFLVEEDHRQNREV